MSGKKLAFYYGPGRLELLSEFDRVVLQAGHYEKQDLAWLRQRGALPLAYLSLGQDVGEPKPWHIGEDNLLWNTHYVDVGHPGWVDRCLEEARTSLGKGFGGLFLDTLDPLDFSPREKQSRIALVRRIRAETGDAYLLVNRGFFLFPELAEYVQGVVFESFSTTWTLDDGLCAVLTAESLERNSLIAKDLAAYPIERYSLDYVHNRHQTAFARARALLHGLSWTIGNRSLSEIPDMRNLLETRETGLDA